MIVAWHEVPGQVPPQSSRPAGYGVIREGVRADSMIEVTKFRREIPLGFAAPDDATPVGSRVLSRRWRALRQWSGPAESEDAP
jgi:hypothetical protein